jgi:hypothetical protein
MPRLALYLRHQHPPSIRGQVLFYARSANLGKHTLNSRYSKHPSQWFLPKSEDILGDRIRAIRCETDDNVTSHRKWHGRQIDFRNR